MPFAAGRRDHVPGTSARDVCERPPRRAGTSTRSARVSSGSWSTTATRLPAGCCRSSFGPLGVEAVSVERLRVGLRGTCRRGSARRSRGAKRLVPMVNADFGAVFDRSAERLLPDRRHRPRGAGRPGSCCCTCADLRRAAVRGKVAVPINATSQIEKLVGKRPRGGAYTRLPHRADARLRRARGGLRRERSAVAMRSRASALRTTR